MASFWRFLRNLFRPMPDRPPLPAGDALDIEDAKAALRGGTGF